MGNPIGNDPKQGPSTTGLIGTPTQIPRHVGIVVPHGPNKEANPFPLSRLTAAIARIFHRVPNRLEKQPRLGVNLLGFLGRNVKKQRVKFFNPRDKAAPLAIGAIGLLGFRKVRLVIPTVGGHFRNARSPLIQVLPKGFQVRRLGIATIHTNNRDVIATGGPLPIGQL